MFRDQASRLRSWWSAATADILGGDLIQEESELDYHLTHPHRVPLAPTRIRRAGTVAARPALCTSPVRPSLEVTSKLPRALS